MFRIIPGLTVVALLSLGASDCTVPRVVDKSANAAEAGDATALVSGCGGQPVPGYVYCRKKEGQITSVDKVTFYGPVGNCERDHCTFITILFPTGEPSHSVVIPKDKTSVSVGWEKLTKRNTFEKLDRGFWPFLVKTYWTDSDGDERLTVQEGELRLRVYDKNYQPLNSLKESPDWGWQWENSGKLFRMTTAGRSWVGAR